MSTATTSQTAGPYWHMIDHPEWADLLREDGPNAGMPGARITLTGRVTDGAGEPVTDAMIEIWHADPAGSYEPPFQGYGRCATDQEGRFRFVTLKPGPVPGRGNALQAPHVVLSIFARGLFKPLFTRLYFAGEPLNAHDPLLHAIDDAARRATLLAEAVGEATWRLDIVLQGERETAFLDI
jgi:protocatechuate 3,4-dioxygenase alpha subunit